MFDQICDYYTEESAVGLLFKLVFKNMDDAQR